MFGSVRWRERYYLVSGSMIRPKVRAVECERATLKWNVRQILYLWSFLARIQTRDAPILIPLLCPAQDVDQFIDEYMPANFSADINDTQSFSAGVEFEDAMLVPLAQIQIFAVAAEI